MSWASLIVGLLLTTVATAAELSPDVRPVLILEPPRELRLHPVDHPADRRGLPLAWRTDEPDRGFSQALLMQLSHVAANWPWRTLIVSASAAETDGHLQTLEGQDAVVAVAHDELVDLGVRVEFQVTLDLTTVRATASPQERRVRSRVEYRAASLPGNSALPRRNRAQFRQDGPLDEQVSTAATDLSQFLALIVARVSVPESLHPHNPTLGALGVHPTCGECRPSDAVIFRQPGRVWVRLSRPPGRILALPLRPPKAGPKGR